jgi:hypothetical protein
MLATFCRLAKFEDLKAVSFEMPFALQIVSGERVCRLWIEYRLIGHLVRDPYPPD